MTVPDTRLQVVLQSNANLCSKAMLFILQYHANGLLLQVLTGISKSKSTVPTTVEFVDIAGLVKGASKGEGLGNQFLANIRECDALVQVVVYVLNARACTVLNCTGQDAWIGLSTISTVMLPTHASSGIVSRWLDVDHVDRAAF